MVHDLTIYELSNAQAFASSIIILVVVAADVVALYKLDFNQRSTFLSKLEIVRHMVTRFEVEACLKQQQLAMQHEHEKQEQRNTLNEQHRQAEVDAFSTVQHAVKAHALTTVTLLTIVAVTLPLTLTIILLMQRTMLNSIFWAGLTEHGHSSCVSLRLVCDGRKNTG